MKLMIPYNMYAMAISFKDYLKELKDRGKESRVYRKYQLTGLELAEILGDEKHKSLYIKIAKDNPNENLIGIAKEIAENKEIENKGAYFMSVLHNKKT